MQTSAPCGIPRSAVWKVSNPRPLMTRVENYRSREKPLDSRHGIDRGATHVTDPSIGDISDQSEGKEHPLEGTRQIWSFPSNDLQHDAHGLVVQHGLANLPPPDPLALDSRLITPHSRQHHQLFLLVEPPRRQWRVGESECDNHSPEGTDGSDDEELESPRGEGSFDVTDTVSDEAAYSTEGSACDQIEVEVSHAHLQQHRFH